MPGFTVEQDSPLTAWGQVQRDLRRRLEHGEFAPGSRIPSEAELTAHYGVSRMTVRRAIEALVADGFLRSRRGSGTFASERDGFVRCDVDLLRPWREQLLATGNIARSRLLEYSQHEDVPEELRRWIEYDDADRLAYGLHLQEVNGVAIAITESWVPASTMSGKTPAAPVSASSSIETAFADATQARLLDVYHDASLLEVTTYSRLRETGELAELARTRWVASRVRLTYRRALSLGHIDMSELASRR